MSMIGCFYAVKDVDLEVIIKTPTRIHQLLGQPQPVTNPPFLSRLFGAKPKSLSQIDQWQPTDEPTKFDVDKAWQGIHFLLTDSPWEGDGPLAFILHGGREIGEHLDGPAHCFTSSKVRSIDEALSNLDPAALFERADPAEFAKNDIYPEIWDREPKEQCIGYVTNYFRELKNFVHQTAESGRGLIIFIA